MVKLTLVLTPESKKPNWILAFTLQRLAFKPESQNQLGLRPCCSIDKAIIAAFQCCATFIYAPPTPGTITGRWAYVRHGQRERTTRPMLPVLLPLRAGYVTCWLDVPGWPRLRLFVWVFGKAAPLQILIHAWHSGCLRTVKIEAGHAPRYSVPVGIIYVPCGGYALINHFSHRLCLSIKPWCHLHAGSPRAIAFSAVPCASAASLVKWTSPAARNILSPLSPFHQSVVMQATTPAIKYGNPIAGASVIGAGNVCSPIRCSFCLRRTCHSSGR